MVSARLRDSTNGTSPPFVRSRIPLIAVLAVIALLPVAVLAQSATTPSGASQQLPARAAQRPNEAARGTAILRGFVVAADTGLPIRRAQLRVSGQSVPSRLATTDAQGRFEIKELPAGRYTLSASKSGFVSLEYGQRRPSESGTPLELSDTQVIEKLVIGLPRGSVIAGRISDEFGEPVANAVVNALRYGYVAGERRLLPASGQNSRDTTDDQGQFRLFGLPPGDYVISAALRVGGEVTDPAGERTGYAPTYFPGTPNIAEAQRVRLAVSQEHSGVVFGLIPTRLVQIIGTAIDSQGAPLTGGGVMLFPSVATGAPLSQSASARVERSGQFRFRDVAPGRYSITAYTADAFRSGQGRSTGELGHQEITVGTDDLNGLVLVTLRGARVTGHVITDTGTLPSFRASQMSIVPRSVGVFAPGPAPGSTRVNDDWTFDIGNVFQTRLFRVNLPEGWHLKHVLLNDRDVTDIPTEFSPGQTYAGMQIVITQKTAAVTGRVTDGRGDAVTDATVVIFPANENLWANQSRFVRTARPDQSGRFEIRGLPPFDRYLAVAVQVLEDGQIGDPEFLTSRGAQATAFTLREDETRALDLRVGAR